MRASANIPTFSSRSGFFTRMRTRAAFVAGSIAGAIATTSPSNAAVGPGVRDDLGLLADAHAAERLGRHVGGHLDLLDVRHLEERLRRGAVHLLADSDEAPDHLPRDRRADVCPRELPVGRGERGLRPAREPASAAAAWLRASSTSLPAAIPRSSSRSVRARLSRAFSSAGLRLREAGPRLALLVLERQRLDLRHHLARAHDVALGHASSP